MRTRRAVSRTLLACGLVLATGALAVATGAAASPAPGPRWATTGQVTVHKTDQAGRGLGGAGFTLYPDDHGLMGPPTRWSCQIPTTASSCSTGQGVTPGTYFVVETTVPKGYVAAAPLLVTVKAETTSALTFVDERAPGAVTVTKTDEAGTALAGAGFTLYTDVGGAPGTATAWTCTIGSVVDGVASCTIVGVAPGSYVVEETTVPPGYAGGAPQRVLVVSDAVVAVTFVDAQIPPPAPTTGAVTVTKTDEAGTALAGAGFTLYTDVGGAPGAATAWACTIGSVVDGVASCTIAGVAPGSYVVEETTVPPGYAGAAPQQVVVDAGATVAVTFRDVPGATTPGGSQTMPAPLSGATTVHTGKPWAGTRLVVVGVAVLGLSMFLAGLVLGRPRRPARNAGRRS
ncbi:MAG TPA: SpaA isopeptide-forming pilin-related protein [Acidimicrobiales bacterium]|nr:SpaA isopeptide-forming pilin-related protein [Acidimicrobiales bacterium]